MPNLMQMPNLMKTPNMIPPVNWNAPGAYTTGKVPGPVKPLPPTQWGSLPALVNPGMNPGYIGAIASQPTYKTTNPTQAQYSWGVKPPVASAPIAAPKVTKGVK